MMTWLKVTKVAVSSEHASSYAFLYHAYDLVHLCHLDGISAMQVVLWHVNFQMLRGA